MKIAVVGATGLVGGVMLQLLDERNFPLTTLLPVASERSAGKKITFKESQFEILTHEQALAQKPDIALFSAGGSVSLEWAPQYAAIGCTVIDNSSAWRMKPNIPLIVPEINADILNHTHKIIANPNCSTIQMVMVLNPLHLKYTIKRIVVSTYQSVSGTGAMAVNQLYDERKGVEANKVYPYQIDLNLLPHIDSFLENGYTKEEMKMVNETKKIMRDDSIRVTSTTVRVPVIGGHSESVNIEFATAFEVQDVITILHATSGVVVQDDIQNKIYPMPLFAEGKDDVYVGRIRRDESQPNTINCWIVADNLRKGAATNAIQIAEYLISKKMV